MIKKYKTATASLATAVIVAVLVGYTVTTGNDHFVLADEMSKKDTGSVRVHLTCVIHLEPGLYPCIPRWMTAETIYFCDILLKYKSEKYDLCQTKSMVNDFVSWPIEASGTYAVKISRDFTYASFLTLVIPTVVLLSYVINNDRSMGVLETTPSHLTNLGNSTDRMIRLESYVKSIRWH